jgi:hypothetical protein
MIRGAEERGEGPVPVRLEYVKGGDDEGRAAVCGMWGCGDVGSGGWPRHRGAKGPRGAAGGGA